MSGLIYDVGDLVPLTSSLTINDGPATLVVTDPSGTITTTPSITFIGNVYASTFRVAMAGRHLVSWTTANNVVQDVFEAQAKLTGIVSLDDVRKWLRLRDADTTDNDKLQALIETATDLIHDVTGPILPTTYTEYFSGGKPSYTVMHPPLISVTSCVEYWGNQYRTLSEQPIGLQTTPFAYSVDYTTGQIIRRTFGGDASLFAAGTKNIVITYLAARVPIPAAIQMATRELVKHLYNNTQIPSGKARMQQGVDSDFAAPISYAVPNFVLDMIPLKYRRPPGIA